MSEGWLGWPQAVCFRVADASELVRSEEQGRLTPSILLKKPPIFCCSSRWPSSAAPWGSRPEDLAAPLIFGTEGTVGSIRAVKQS
ncbi:hypothetical protein [Parasphingorhabdus pacifica]